MTDAFVRFVNEKFFVSGGFLSETVWSAESLKKNRFLVLKRNKVIVLRQARTIA